MGILAHGFISTRELAALAGLLLLFLGLFLLAGYCLFRVCQEMWGWWR